MPLWPGSKAAFPRHCLAPTLVPGDVVIADILGSHKDLSAGGAAVRAHRLLLPPCNPDLNPIEVVFAKLKTLFGKAGDYTVETLW